MKKLSEWDDYTPLGYYSYLRKYLEILEECERVLSFTQEEKIRRQTIQTQKFYKQELKELVTTLCKNLGINVS